MHTWQWVVLGATWVPWGLYVAWLWFYLGA